MANRSLRWIRLKCNEWRGVNKEGVPHEASAISDVGSGARLPFPDCTNRALSGAWRTRGWRWRRPWRWWRPWRWRRLQPRWRRRLQPRRWNGRRRGRRWIQPAFGVAWWLWRGRWVKERVSAQRQPVRWYGSEQECRRRKHQQIPSLLQDSIPSERFWVRSSFGCSRKQAWDRRGRQQRVPQCCGQGWRRATRWEGSRS